MQEKFTKSDLRAITFYTDRMSDTVAALESGTITVKQAVAVLRTDIAVIDELATKKDLE